MVRSAQAKPAPTVASDTSRSFGWAASELPSSEDLDLYPGLDAPTTAPDEVTPRYTLNCEEPEIHDDELGGAQPRTRTEKGPRE